MNTSKMIILLRILHFKSNVGWLWWVDDIKDLPKVLSFLFKCEPESIFKIYLEVCKLARINVFRSMYLSLCYP